MRRSCSPIHRSRVIGLTTDVGNDLLGGLVAGRQDVACRCEQLLFLGLKLLDAKLQVAEHILFVCALALLRSGRTGVS